MKKKKNSDNQAIAELLKSLSAFLDKIGYSDDPRILPRLKNSSFFHKTRKKMFSGGLPPTTSGIEDNYKKIEKNYDLLKIGFWSVFPVLFAAVPLQKMNEKGFSNFIKNFNRDLSFFFPYCTKCTFRVTIWPRVQIHSYPKGYLAIINDNGDSQNETIKILQKEWSQLADYEKFYVLPPMIIDAVKKDIIFPFSKTKITKFPPSYKELKKALFK
jgi:hypothetical protein